NRLICDKLNIKPNDALLFFSSQRDDNWLKPFLDQSIGKLPELGWKKVAIMSPGFPSDNMETLFDIDIEARKLFMDAGGEKFSFIPSLNYNEEWVDAIWNIIEKM
ncbi:MAG: ferrochelatase, partial [Bacteroidales bacterium]|nr:ferrochelatase [Bacteroidales bacterium]